MIKSFLILLAFVISARGLCSPGEDSLKILLTQHTSEDSVRVSLLLKYGKSLFFTKQDGMMYYADEALRISEKIGWKTGIADAYQLKGVSYSYVLSDPVHAIEYYQKALDANEPLKRKTFEWQTLANIALLYHDQEEYSDALRYYEKATSVLNTLKDKSGENRLFMNLGHLYFDMGRADDAMKSYSKSLTISKKIGDSLAIANLLNSMGYIFLQQQDYSRALPLIRQSLLMADVTGNLVTKASALVNLSLVSLHTNDLDKAATYAGEALELSKEVGNLQFQRQSWDALQKIYEKEGKYKLSLNAYKEYILLNDSLINTENQKQITRKEMQFQFDKKRALDQAELARQLTIKKSIMGGAALLFLASVTGIFLYKKRRDAEEKKKAAEFKYLVSETEMKALRAQMNPHFIFNSLSAISDYMMKNDAGMADAYLGKFSQLMRMVLENSDRKEILLSEDIEILKLYMDLEALRLNKTFTYQIIHDGLDPENILVPPLLLQPFVENSIKHGFAGKDDIGEIKISFQKEQDMLICNIEDNGVGITASNKPMKDENKIYKKSMGIMITKSRIQILNEGYKANKASLKVADLNHGTNIEIKIPFTLKF